MGFLDAEISVTLADDGAIAELAGRWGRPAAPTDVLAFAQHEGPRPMQPAPPLGDVILSVERAEAQARARGVPLDAELRDLLIHGTLHLLGLDHQRARDARAMREIEDHLRWELERIG